MATNEAYGPEGVCRDRGCRNEKGRAIVGGYIVPVIHVQGLLDEYE